MSFPEDKKENGFKEKKIAGFSTSKIFLHPDTVSEQLRTARQSKRLKLPEVAKKLNINHTYLEALENNEFWKLPKGVYGKNFLKEYAMFLGLDYRDMMEVFEKEALVLDADKEKQLFSAQVVKNSYFLAIPRIFRNSVIALVIIVCFVYLAIRLDKIVSPPPLILSSPQENLITLDKTIEVIGTTEPESQIIINGELVLSDVNGAFSKKVDLKNGINVITITAKKKYGRTNAVQRQILVKDEGLEL